jgi:hypothetical protein
VLTESARMTSAAEAQFRIAEPPPTRRAVTVIDLAGADDRSIAAIDGADLVVMRTAAGADAGAAAAIGRACSERRIPTATLVVRPADAPDGALSRTLAQVRPWSLMVVVAGDESYLDDLLTSFR